MVKLRRLKLFSLAGVWRGLLPPSFPVRETESTFWAAQARRLTPQRRTGIGLTLLIWVAYVGFDFASFRENHVIHPEVLTLRALGIAVLVAALAVTYCDRFKTERFAELVICAFGTLLYAFVLTMVTVVDFPISYVYDYTGLLLFILGFVGLFRLRARAVLTVLPLWFLISIPALALAALETNPNGHSIGDWRALLTAMTSYAYFAAISYLLSFMLIGAAIAALLEREARSAFVRERQLVESRRKVEAQTQALIAAKEDLRSLADQQNRNKSKFLADAAHDLSQPVHAVSLLIESARHALTRGDQAKTLALIDAAGHAARLTRSSFMAVLELSQLESGLVRPAYSVFSVDDLIAEVATSMRVIAEAQGVVLRVRRSRVGSSSIRSDRALLERALANLLSNAIKYADPDKGAARAVLVGAVALAERVRIEVVDNGVGIPAERCDDVFQPFVQLDNPGRDREKGLGLGLSIVAATADLLTGHALRMHSIEGRGTRFALEAPRQEGRRLIAPSPAALDGSADLASLFVWCVEDDEMTREATIALLDELGILSEQSASLEALERALDYTERAPDLVISDYRLSADHSADDVVRAFARRWSTPIPILILTGDVAPSGPLTVQDQAIFLTKPAAPEAFIAAIRRLCFLPGQALELAATGPGETAPRSG
jgi:two-component system, sensor histidine kinase